MTASCEVTATPKAMPLLEIYEAEDGIVIYDPLCNQMHHLNHTAAAVFHHCTGSLTVSQIASEIQALFELPSAPVRNIQSCVAELFEHKLVTE